MVLVSKAAELHPFLGLSPDGLFLEEVWRDRRVCTSFMENLRVLLGKKGALFMDL